MPDAGFIDCSIPDDDDPGPRRQRRRIHRCRNRMCGALDCETCQSASDVSAILQEIDEELEISGDEPTHEPFGSGV